jgi:hypothetical protein
MKCLRILLRGMSHFSSPRRCISAGAASVRSATQDEPNQPGSTQSVDILFDGGRSTAAGRQHERPIPEISADGWRKFSALACLAPFVGPSPTRVRDAFWATTSICALVHRYIWAVRAFPDEAVIGAIPSDDSGAATEKCGGRRLEPSLWGYRPVYRRSYDPQRGMGEGGPGRRSASCRRINVSAVIAKRKLS